MPIRKRATRKDLGRARRSPRKPQVVRSKPPRSRLRQQSVELRPHVFARPGAKFKLRAQRRVGFDYPATLRGKTDHFTVYYDPALPGGPDLADGVLASCEREFETLRMYFGAITPAGLPFNVIIAPGIGGAYHYGCGATDLYCDGERSRTPDIDHTRMLVVAEEVEVFSDAQAFGWDCGASNGEGLSRVLATELYPAELDGFASAASWLDSKDRPNFVDENDPTDTNYVSIGCSVLFLNYLRYQLEFGWDQIVHAGAQTLGLTYRKLTGATDGFSRFAALLQSRYPVGARSGLTTDNPFPL